MLGPIEMTGRSVMRRMAWLTAIAAARLIAVASLTTAVLANIGRMRRARVILLYPGGGFGHTIIAPDWLRRLHPEGPNLTFFATYPRGLNRRIADIWGHDAVAWVRTGFRVPGQQAVTDVAWSYRLFGILDWMIRFLAPRKTCYYTLDALVQATPRAPGTVPGSLFESRYEGRYYALMRERPAPALHLGTATRTVVESRLRERFGNAFPRRCAFYIRYPAELNDPTSASRRSPAVDAFLPSFRVLNAAGYQVLVTGDAVIPPEMIRLFQGGLVDWSSTGLDKDVFMLFAGLEVEAHIGNLSGGSAFLYISDIPGLMLNAWAIGDALPRTTVHYKRVCDLDGNLVPPKRLFTELFFDFEAPGYIVEDATPEDMATEVQDFIEHCRDHQPYGIDPAEIGIDAPWFQAANARLSPTWLKSFGAHPIARHGGALGEPVNLENLR
jgi:hypothetical protein